MFVFVVMPFKVDKIYEDCIKPVLQQEGCEVVRGDTHQIQRNIMKDILEYLNRADLVIVDITGHNPNVFYELALAQAFLKPTFVITQDDISKLPFDISGYRAQKYSFDIPAEIKAVKDKLREYVKMFHEGKLEAQNPLIDFLPNYRPPINDQNKLLTQLQTMNSAYINYQEFLTTKKYELAIRLDMVSREVRDAFINARSPFGYGAPEYRPNSTVEEKKKQDNDYDRKWRLEPIINSLGKLYEIRSEFSILFNRQKSLDIPIEALNNCVHQLSVNLTFLHSGNHSEKIMNIVFRGYESPDTFSEEVDAAIEALLDIAHHTSL